MEALAQPSPGPLRDALWLSARRAQAYAAITALACMVSAFGLIAGAEGLRTANGAVLGTDFASFYAAADLAWAGAPDAAYDPARHHAAQIAAVGEGAPYAAFFYPPIFLLACLPLGLLSYGAAFLAWTAAGVAACAWALTAAVRRFGWTAFLGFPALWLTIGHGQTSLFVTALLAGGLQLSDRRPALAGVLLGALAFKPHLAILIPPALIVLGRWRCLGAMAATALGLAGVSYALFGGQTWAAFFAASDLARATLEQGLVEPWKMQSVFAAARLFEASVWAAYGLQAVAAAVAAGLLWRVLRRGDPAWPAALVLASLLATPFLLDYDLMLLAPALALLLAQAQTHGFRPYERGLLALAFAAPMLARPLAQTLHAPIVPGLALALLALIALRPRRQASGGNTHTPPT